MKKLLAILSLALVVILLSGCAPKEEPADQLNTMIPDAPTQAPAMTMPSAEPIPDDYDRSSEEDKDREYVDGVDPVPVTEASNIYAGATPIALNPIDMPTPTPHPPMVFNYETYTATNIGLSFEMVAGYEVDASQPEVYVLTEPLAQQKDNYSAQFTFTVTNVNSNYRIANVNTDLRAKLEELGQMDYRSWSPSSRESRTLLNAQGYYADYRGVKTDGTIVRGRVQMALLPGNKLLTVHMSVPAEYNTDFIGVFTRIRNTIKAL